MAGRSGKCRTIGFLKPDGNIVTFEKPRTDLDGKRYIARMGDSWNAAVERWQNGTWEDGFDCILFADVKEHLVANGVKRA